MTASAILELRVTEFSLALLEGSGWYQVDYSKAEPITYGKNQGCDFLDTPCVDNTTFTANFEEFCSPLETRACSRTYRGFAYCGTPTALTSTDASLPASFDYWRN